MRCEDCSHKPVCGHKKELSRAVELANNFNKELSEHVKLSVICRHYLDDTRVKAYGIKPIEPMPLPKGWEHDKVYTKPVEPLETKWGDK